ncbi:MAG: extracellular solute-binding protein [Bacilli bacterium]|jgi:ABC-type glycerol-3-phosphate transport system substrate-binding protein
MVRRRTGLFLSLVGLWALTGCQSGGNDSDVISFWAYQPSTQTNQNEFRAMIAGFTEETGIKVKLNLVVKDSYNTALTSALTGRSQPDLAYLDQPLIADYASDGTLYAIDELLAGSTAIAADQFYESVFQTNVFQNHTYGIPLNMTTTVLFYNKDLVETVPTTWDQWLAVKDGLPDGKSLFDGIGNGGYAGWYFQSFLANCGGSLLNEQLTAVTFNDERGQEAAEMIKNLYGNDPTSINNRATSDAFGNGLVAFKLGSSSDLDRFDINFPNLDYGVALVPSQTEGTSSSNMGGENLVVFDHSSLKEECWTLIEYLLEEDNVSKLADYTGNFPAVTEYLSSDDPRRQIIIEQLETAEARPVVTNWIRVNDEYLGPALSDKILSDVNPRDIKTSLDNAAAAATQLLFG